MGVSASIECSRGRAVERFKASEIGPIPLDWQVANLGAHLREPIRNGFSPVCPKHATGVWILSLASVDVDGYQRVGAKPAPYGDPRVRQTQLEIGDLLVSRSNTPERVGLAGIYDGTPAPCSYPDLLMRVRVRESLNTRFLLAQMLGDRGRKYFSANARGSSSSMVKIDRSILEYFPVAIPSPAEQSAIAEALSDADALIESLEQLLAKKRQIKQGAMQELLTGKRRLPGFANNRGHRLTEVGDIPNDWDLEYVESLASITTGSRNTQDRKDEGQYPFFVRSQTVERIDSYSFDGEAVLTAGDGVGTGKVFHYINGKFDAHQRVYRISNFSQRMDGYFFFLYFSTHFYSRIMQMTAKSSVDSVRREMIARMLIPVPSSKAEQESISKTLSDMDSEITALEVKVAKAREIKQGMMQELLTGKIRLV